MARSSSSIIWYRSVLRPMGLRRRRSSMVAGIVGMAKTLTFMAAFLSAQRGDKVADGGAHLGGVGGGGAKGRARADDHAPGCGEHRGHLSRQPHWESPVTGLVERHRPGPG